MIVQNLSQRQQTKILPQQIQLLNLFHLTNLELEAQIRIELEENPLLEEIKDTDTEESHDETISEFADWEEYVYDDIPDYKTEYANYFSGEVMPEKPITQEVNFRQVLKEQVRLQLDNEVQCLLADYLIDSLNDSGILELSLEQLAEEISFKNKKWIDASELTAVLSIIQQLDPPGVGALNMQQCLLLQMDRIKSPCKTILQAIELIRGHYDSLIHKDMEKIKLALKISHEELKEILNYLGTLHFRPVLKAEASETIKEIIFPDFVIHVEDDKIKVSLTKQRSQTLSINHSWMDHVQNQLGDKDKAGKQYLRNKLLSAEWFVSAIQQRESNMLAIMKAIVNWQKNYFLSGDMMQVKPMILKNIADKTGVDISTVSRITSHKYAATPFGNILLKSLFSEGLKDLSGETISSRVVQKALKNTIEKEDKHSPYTDNELVEKLADNGFKLARRTVAKYRELLQIPAAQVRGIWK